MLTRSHGRTLQFLNHGFSHGSNDCSGGFSPLLRKLESKRLMSRKLATVVEGLGTGLDAVRGRVWLLDLI